MMAVAMAFPTFALKSPFNWITVATSSPVRWAIAPIGSGWKPGKPTATQPTTHIWYEKRLEYEPWNR